MFQILDLEQELKKAAGEDKKLRPTDPPAGPLQQLQAQQSVVQELDAQHAVQELAAQELAAQELAAQELSAQPAQELVVQPAPQEPALPQAAQEMTKEPELPKDEPEQELEQEKAIAKQASEMKAMQTEAEENTGPTEGKSEVCNAKAYNQYLPDPDIAHCCNWINIQNNLWVLHCCNIWMEWYFVHWNHSCVQLYGAAGSVSNIWKYPS